MSYSKKDLNEKFISFLDQVKDEKHKSVTHLNDRVLVIDGLNTFIRSFAVNPAINEDGLHIGGMMGFLKSIRYTCDILKPSRCIIVFDGKDGSKNTIGIKIKGQVIKNRLGPPMRTAEFPLYFDTGISDYDSWLTVMKDHKIVKSGGSWYTLQHVDVETGELIKEHKFQSKDYAELMDNNPDLKQFCYERICEACILKYDSKELGIDDVTETDEAVDEL